MGEDHLIAILRGHDDLHRKQILHHVEDAPGQKSCIVLSGNEGSRQLEGPRGYAINVQIEMRSSEAKIPTDQTARAVREAIQTAPTIAIDTRFAVQIWIFDEDISTSREDTEHLRVRIMEVPLLMVPMTTISPNVVIHDDGEEPEIPDNILLDDAGNPILTDSGDYILI